MRCLPDASVTADAKWEPGGGGPAGVAAGDGEGVAAGDGEGDIMPCEGDTLPVGVSVPEADAGLSMLASHDLLAISASSAAW